MVTDVGVGESIKVNAEKNVADYQVDKMKNNYT